MKPRSTIEPHSFVKIEKLKPKKKKSDLYYFALTTKIISFLGIGLVLLFITDTYLTPKVTVSKVEIVKRWFYESLAKVDDKYFLTDSPPLNYFETGDTIGIATSPVFDIIVQVNSTDEFYGIRSEYPEKRRTITLFSLSILIGFFSLGTILVKDYLKSACIGTTNIIWLGMLIQNLFYYHAL